MRCFLVSINIIAFALPMLALTKSASAVGVANWQTDPGAVAVTNGSTSSPTIGDGSANSTNGTHFWSDFSQMSIADGQQVTLSGSAELLGISPDPHIQFRFGLFDNNGQSGINGWKGFLVENSGAGQNGFLHTKNPAAGDFLTAPFGSSIGDRVVTLAQTVDPDGDQFLSGTYDMSLVVKRFGSELVIDSSIVSTDANDFQNQWSGEESDPGRVTFDFNRVGFLAGGSLGADQINLGNMDVTVEDINALTLEVNTTSGAVTILNNRPADSFDINYYEIRSDDAGSLDIGWSGVDGSIPVSETSWEQAGGSTENLLAEGSLEGLILSPAGSASLGTAYMGTLPADQDIEFYYGITGGELQRGLVTYVTGPGGDFDGDTDVDGADFLKWQRDDASPGGLAAWQAGYGTGTLVSGVIASVPEPASCASGLIALLVVSCRRRLPH